MTTARAQAAAMPDDKKIDHLRHHRSSEHLGPTFGTDAFALKAEAFARFFGTPVFLGGQTIVVITWIVLNATGIVTFDVFPFILLNLAFSLQSAYAAPLILLAQTRQSARDKAQTDADAQHREELAQANARRQEVAVQHTEQLLALLEQNTKLTELTRALTQRVEHLTVEMHQRLSSSPSSSSSSSS